MRNVTEFSKRDANYLLTSILDRCDAMRSEGGSPDIVLSGIEDLIRQSKDSVDLPKQWYQGFDSAVERFCRFA